MKKGYCTQNQGHCVTCSLTNYGLDCANNPLQTAKLKVTKHSRMMAAYKGHAGPVTVAAVQEQIPAELMSKLTGHQIGLVMTAVNAAYHNGKAAQEAEEVIYIKGAGLLPRAILAQVKISQVREEEKRDPDQVKALGGPESWPKYTTTYKLDAVEVY